MQRRVKSYKRLIASLSLATMLTAAVAMPALAEEDTSIITFEIGDAGYEITVSADPEFYNPDGDPITDDGVTEIPYSFSGTTISTMSEPGNLEEDRSPLVIDFSSVSTDAWTVSMTASTPHMSNFSRSNISIIPRTVTAEAGQGDANEITAGTPGPFIGSDPPEPLVLASAEDGDGWGAYSQEIDITITVPNTVEPGENYTSTLTITIASEVEDEG